MDKDQIVNEIYEAYGSDSGVLFGIKERGVVKAIVEFTLNRCDKSTPSITLQQGLDIWDAAEKYGIEITDADYNDKIQTPDKAAYFASIGIDIEKYKQSKK